MANHLFDNLTLFQDLTQPQRALVKPLFMHCHYPAGTMIFEQGDETEFLYLIVQGEVLIRYKPEDGPAINVARVRPEGVVGWSAALGSPCYTSGAVCTEDCEMLRIRGEDLRQLYESNPETGALVLERLATLIAQRLRNTHEKVLGLLTQGLRIQGFPSFQLQ